MFRLCCRLPVNDRPRQPSGRLLFLFSLSVRRLSRRAAGNKSALIDHLLNPRRSPKRCAAEARAEPSRQVRASLARAPLRLNNIRQLLITQSGFGRPFAGLWMAAATITAADDATPSESRHESCTFARSFSLFLSFSRAGCSRMRASRAEADGLRAAGRAGEQASALGGILLVFLVVSRDTTPAGAAIQAIG